MTCSNKAAVAWVEQVASLTEPSKVTWINGSEAEYAALCQQLVQDKVFTPLNPQSFPNSFWCRSHANDVARVEDRTFICCREKKDAGPLNNWMAPTEMYTKLNGILQGSMRGRTMYVVPYLMGPDGSSYSKVGFELTDSPYVVTNMRIMARIGEVALKNLKPEAKFVKGIHTIGSLDPEKRYIAHFPEDATIISVNSNYGGNALQGKKCFALRIASCLARDEGWLAEHMLIVGITNPQGKKLYFTGAFPSACGKTNLAMLVPPKSYLDAGWKVETVGDDIAWLNWGSDGRLYAINPEAGFFGVAPGTSRKSNPNAMDTISKNTIFTNTALDLEAMTPWWEGCGLPTPKKVRDWLGNDWEPESGTKAAHPNSRFTVPASQCPSIDPNWQSPGGVPIAGIIFGGRRARTAPLVYEALNWQHGTYIGTTMASETTAAAVGKVGELRRDPMAMRPFIGYDAANYFRHWLDVGGKSGAKLPAIFHVNWFRTDDQGKFLWPGYGENMRVLEWIFNRVSGTARSHSTALGIQPSANDLNIDGLAIGHDEVERLLTVSTDDWRNELSSQEEFFKSLGDGLPQELWQEHGALKARLGLR